MRIKLAYLTLIVTLFCVSCSSKPSFINVLKPLPGGKLKQTDEISFALEQKELWEIDNGAEELTNHIIENTQVFVDNNRVDYAKLDFIFLTSILEPVFDRQGNVLGGWGGSITVTVKDRFPLGSHNVEVQVTTISGKKFSYSWDFETVNQ